MNTKLTLLSLFTLALVVTGCTRSTDQTDADDTRDAPIVMDEMPPTVDQHTHPEHGPHGGELVELGGEALHIEIVPGDGAVEFFVLDEAAVDPVAIVAPHTTVSLKHDGAVKSFQVNAMPQAGESDGATSRFVSSDAELAQWLKAGAEGAVTIQVDGKSFTGEIHHHEH